MNFRSVSVWIGLAASAGGLMCATAGCEIIAAVDREKITAAGGGGAGGEGGAGGSTTTGGGMGGTGGVGECMSPGDCPPTGTECTTATCEDNTCGTSHVDAGTPLGAQVPGDCRMVVCDGAGNAAMVNDDTDTEDDAQSCTTDTCSDGNPVHTPVTPGTLCTENNGKVCSATGTCVECVLPSDCMTGVCQANVCQSAMCGDGTQNGDETDVDCGGSCGPCADGGTCMIGNDCESKVCDVTCQAPTCMDGQKNGGEGDVDCGAVCPSKCPTGQGCTMPSDCVGGSCLANVCAPTCSDGLKNNAETDVDCGGPVCADCTNGDMCLVGADCVSGFCNPTTLVCATPTCSDGFQNGGEAGVDCGGPCPLACTGQVCATDAQCASAMCYGGLCVAGVNGCTVATAMDLTASATTAVTFPNGNFTYAPKCIKVSLNTVVTFDGSFASHPLQGGHVEGGVPVPAASGPFVPVTNTGTTKDFTMDASGTFPYYCVPHASGGMNGAVFVVMP